MCSSLRLILPNFPQCTMQVGQVDHEDIYLSPHSPLLDRDCPNDKVQKIHAEYMQPQ